MKRLSAPLLLLALACHGAAAAAAVPARPNVLFIAIDDLRTALGCYGDPLVKSPNIDRLAQSGRMFTAAYTQQAVCGPARAALMTGKLPDNTRVWHNRNLFRDTLPDLVTLPQMFMRNGYHAASMGKTFSGDPREEDPQSWSVPFILKQPGWRNYALPENQANEGKGPSHEMADVPDNGYTDGKLAELAVKTLHDLKAREQPFFLAVGFFKPHLPFNAPKKYWDLYDPAVFDLENEIPRVSAAPELAYHSHRELGGYTDMPKDERLSAEQTRTMRHGYYACVSYVDAQVGKLLDTLDQLGLADNTIVVLWGDHGYSLGEANRWCKGTNFELDTRVPLMVRVPGMESPGQATQALVELVDIYPTLAELAGLQPPAGLDGRSFTAVLRDPAQPHREFVQSQFSRPWRKPDPEIMGYSIRTADYRYGRWIDFKTRETVAEELYDYADPASVTARAEYRIENTNKVSDPALAGVLDGMRARLDSALAGRVDQPDAAAKAEPFLEKSDLFAEGGDGFALYRIPGIVVTARGTVLAYCEARKFTGADRGEIEVHLRRSTDGGRSFSPAVQVAHMGPRLARNPHMPKSKQGKDMGGPDEQTVNNPVAIAARDGTVHLLYCVEYSRAFHIRSDDDGLTWSAPAEITAAFDTFRPQLDWQAIATGPGHAVELDNGRLVAPFWMATYDESAPLRKAVGVVYSDDRGATWQGGEIAVRDGGEPNIAQLPDGRVIVTSRSGDRRGRRPAAWSADGVAGWSLPEFIDDLPEPGCMAGITSHPGAGAAGGPFLLYSNPDTTRRAHQDRVNVTVRLSRDGGRSWPVARLLEDGPSAYSDLAVLPDGTILCFYESGDPHPPKAYKRKWAYSYLRLARFNPDWLLQQ